MAHSFEVHQLPNDETLMVCKCGMTYRYSAKVGSWYEVVFRDSGGSYVEPPVGRCGTDGEQKQQREEVRE